MRKQKRAPEKQHRLDFWTIVFTGAMILYSVTLMVISGRSLGWNPLAMYGVPVLVMLIIIIVSFLAYRYLPDSPIGRFIRYKQKTKKEAQADSMR